jgi:hypothetical protein
MKPSLSRIRWTLFCCAIAALAFTSAAQHPAPHNNPQKLVPLDLGVKKSQPTPSQNAKSPATKPAVEKPSATENGVAHSSAAQHPVPKNEVKVQQHFSQLTSGFKTAEARIQSALDTANAQLKKFPSQAATLKPRIDSLNQLLLHVNQLEKQAATVQEPVQARIREGAKLDKSEAAAAENYTKAQVKLANGDADQADKIAEDVNKNSVTAGSAQGAAAESNSGNVPANAAGSVPANAAENASGNIAGNAPDGANVPAEPSAPPPDPEVLWFKKLQNGRLHYKVPPTMDWSIPSTVTVTIDGEAAPPTPLPGETGEAAIKVARDMTVQLSCPDHPDEFTFTPEPGTTPRQHVFADGTATWNWSVTPKYTGTQRKIKIQAWVVYSDKDKNNIERELPVYDTAVDVHLPEFSECVKRLLEGNVEYWLHYGLPGGAGFVFASGVLTGLWKLLSNGKKPAPAS